MPTADAHGEFAMEENGTSVVRTGPRRHPVAVPCEVGRIQWGEGSRADLLFLSLSLENERRLHQMGAPEGGY
jgi:hypothetical protein